MKYLLVTTIFSGIKWELSRKYHIEQIVDSDD